jgi:hypothetical protein
MLRRALVLLLAGSGCTGSDEPPAGQSSGVPEDWEELACAWEDRVDGGADIIDWADVAALASDGGVVVGGAIHPSAYDEMVWLRRYSATGEVLWTTQDEPGGDLSPLIWRLALDPQDRIGATGYIAHPDHAMDLWVAAYEATGELAWSLDLGSEGKGNDACFAPTGELYVTGEVIDLEHSAGTLLWVGKFATDGTLLWTHSEAGQPGNNEGTALVCDDSGGVVVLGALIRDGGYGDSWTRRYDPDGNELWTTIVTDPQGSSPEELLFDGTRDEVLVAAYRVDGKRLYRLALADGAITAEAPAPEQRIFAADAGGTYVDGNFAVEGDPDCDDPYGDPCELIRYWGYAYYDWDAELVWWRAATTGVPNEESRSEVHSLAVADGARVLVGSLEDDIWVCYQ